MSNPSDQIVARAWRLMDEWARKTGDGSDIRLAVIANMVREIMGLSIAAAEQLQSLEVPR